MIEQIKGYAQGLDNEELLRFAQELKQLSLDLRAERAETLDELDQADLEEALKRLQAPAR